MSDKIANHDYAPGERLQLDSLAVQLGVSRTPVRDALNQLAAEAMAAHIESSLGKLDIQLAPADHDELVNGTVEGGPPGEAWPVHDAHASTRKSPRRRI